MVSCSTLCTFESLERTSRVSRRMRPTYILLRPTNTGMMATVMSASTLSIVNR